jgi:hypothetical protein
VWTRSCLNIVATSDEEDEAVTDLGIKVGAVMENGWRVVKSTMGIGAWTRTGVSTGNSCDSGTGESAMAPAVYSSARSLLLSEDIYERACW